MQETGIKDCSNVASFMDSEDVLCGVIRNIFSTAMEGEEDCRDAVSKLSYLRCQILYTDHIKSERTKKLVSAIDIGIAKLNELDEELEFK